MLNTLPSSDDRVSTAHRAKLAYVYVRQSTPGQVRHHQESTELQYRLVDRAVRLGWPRERVQVIDDDLGKTGTVSDGRQGFQQLIAEIGLGKAGLVISLEASRLARNNKDWHQLLELCSLFGVLIADGERLFDPGAYHDRLLLGLSGIMSEAEMHQIGIRLHQSERQKAARGELRLSLPAGLAYDRGGGIVLNPDEEVQARLRLVFAKFRELHSVKAVMRYLQRAGLAVPVRPLRGPAPHEIVWQPADSGRVLFILKNPAYAGAYVYGRRQLNPIGRRPGIRRATVAVALEDWSICLRDIHPGYISWEEFIINQKRLADNLNRYTANHPGIPRSGCALLQGIAVCGHCGRRLAVCYSGQHGEYPVYRCKADHSQEGRPFCQDVRALAVDAEVERVMLAALAPDQIALAVAALGQIEEEIRVLEHQWALKRERARYEAERARRQYNEVEPENRLVARSLERAWEDKLRRVEEVEQDYDRWRREQLVSVAETDRAEILTLGEDLPRVWYAATTTSADRKRILRLLVKEVALDQQRDPGQVWIKIIWQTGAISEHRLQRRVQGYAHYTNVEKLERRVRELNAEGKMDREIAAVLNADRIVTARGVQFSGPGVH
jgi:DNA invertase Pin-like site-specific DNA recombinase